MNRRQFLRRAAAASGGVLRATDTSSIPPATACFRQGERERQEHDTNAPSDAMGFPVESGRGLSLSCCA
ncbi:MAG: hypothetical protein FJ386_14065 [Verrucomicrobia bacterium]|nr:hypothetical protein [Verrucomicrobiota bacterium]